jgi:hypothetical protein
MSDRDRQISQRYLVCALSHIRERAKVGRQRQNVKRSDAPEPVTGPDVAGSCSPSDRPEARPPPSSSSRPAPAARTWNAGGRPASPRERQADRAQNPRSPSPARARCLWAMSLDHRTERGHACSFSSAQCGNIRSMHSHSYLPHFILGPLGLFGLRWYRGNPCAPWSWTPPRLALTHSWSVVAAPGLRVSMRCGQVFCT